MFATDREKTSREDYKVICIDFIEQISNDYKEWVYKYRLDKEEERFRTEMIDYIVKNTNLWIAKYGDTIKKIDIIKDDGLSKMAGFTAGYPFKFHILVNSQELYAIHNASKIRLEVIAEASMDDRKVRITNLREHEFVNILSSSDVNVIKGEFIDSRSIHNTIIVDATNSKPSDIISATVAVEELSNDIQIDKRALSIIIRIE
ncbi:MAG: hypothetical protein QXK74_01440 [Candidatus Nitrosocaldaceae archaeon]